MNVQRGGGEFGGGGGGLKLVSMDDFDEYREVSVAPIEKIGTRFFS